MCSFSILGRVYNLIPQPSKCLVAFVVMQFQGVQALSLIPTFFAFSVAWKFDELLFTWNLVRGMNYYTVMLSDIKIGPIGQISKSESESSCFFEFLMFLVVLTFVLVEAERIRDEAS